MQTLQKGGNISLTKTAPNCNEMIIAIKWLKNTNDDTEYDIDGSAFMLTENNKIRTDADFIFYNQPKSPNNAIELVNTQEPNVQFFKVNLNSVTTDITKVSFVLTLHEAKERQQNFGMLQSIVVKVLKLANKEELISYVLTEVEIETALILVELYRYSNEWKFKAIGQGYIDGLDILARHYGVNIDGEESQSEKKTEPPKKPTVLKYIDVVKPNIEKFVIKAKQAKHQNINESGTRLLIDNVLQAVLGYQIQHIKTEHRIPNRQIRVDYLLSLDGKNIMTVEAKQINLALSEKHVSQATSYAYYLDIDFALLTNGIEWNLYYVIPKKLKKYEYHLVFSINLLEYNDKTIEKLFSISRFGVVEQTLDILKSKMDILYTINDVILSTEITEKMTAILNQKNPQCQITLDEVRNAIEMNIFK